jgi:hypothetical protein
LGINNNGKYYITKERVNELYGYEMIVNGIFENNKPVKFDATDINNFITDYKNQTNKSMFNNKLENVIQVINNKLNCSIDKDSENIDQEIETAISNAIDAKAQEKANAATKALNKQLNDTKNENEQFMNELKEILGLTTDKTFNDIKTAITNIKETEQKINKLNEKTKKQHQQLQQLTNDQIEIGDSIIKICTKLNIDQTKEPTLKENIKQITTQVTQLISAKQLRESTHQKNMNLIHGYSTLCRQITQGLCNVFNKFNKIDLSEQAQKTLSDFYNTIENNYIEPMKQEGQIVTTFKLQKPKFVVVNKK